MACTKDATALAKRLRRMGYAVRVNGAGHWEVRDGERHVGSFPVSPGGGRWRKNTIADLRRAGVPL